MDDPQKALAEFVEAVRWRPDAKLRAYHEQTLRIVEARCWALTRLSRVRPWLP